MQAAGGHFFNGTRYGVDEIAAFAGHGGRHGAIGEAFFDLSIAQNLRTLVYGKRVLDIGCGVGVDGFDIQEEMVEIAKQATAQLDTVSLRVGDAADMPYGDASFDVAISLFVTCNLLPEAFAKHFLALNRVLIPGGKAILLTPTDDCNSKLYTKIGANPSCVERDIAHILTRLPKNPSTVQVTEAFRNVDDIFVT